jgi:penicillin-binding protein 1A
VLIPEFAGILSMTTAFFKRLKERLSRAVNITYLKLQPFIHYVQVRYDRVSHYFKTHPKARKISIIAAIVLGPPLLLLLVVWIEIPSKKALRNIQNQVASEVYSADSVLLGRYYIQDRTEIKYEDIAPVAIDALLATEDIRFYDHSGVDYNSMGRVVIKSIFLQDESAGGGSTLTQQLSKNLFPRRNYWILSMPINKMREVITALRLEDIYTKEDLITMYLNTVPFADQTFGIEAAAKRFYSTTAKKLTPTQAAVIIGMLKATHSYNPRLFPKRSLARRNVVLEQMEKYHFIPNRVVDSLQQLPLNLNYNRVSYHQGLAPYFREYLKTELVTWCKNNVKEDGSPYNIYTDGLRVYTTIDSKLQAYAEKAVAQQMKEVQRQFYNHLGKDTPWKGNESVIMDAMKRTNRYERLKEQGLSDDEIIREMNKKVPMRLFTWDGDKDGQISPIDSIKHHIQILNAGFLAMEPSSGKLLAWVGGIEHDFFQFDHVKPSTKRQVGSIFKPIVYAMAIEKGVKPCEFISAERQTYIDEEGEKWTPRNSQVDYKVKYSMPGALAYSVNTVAVKLIQRAGVNSTIDLARNMGIKSDMNDVPSVALGSPSVSLMEMTTAYACLANEGVASTPYYIQSIHDMQGKVYEDFKPTTKGRVLSKETAKLVTHMLQTVVHEGTASRLRWKYGIYNDVAGKTGTTQANADGWFMAMTPKLVMGTWVGADDPRIHFRNTELGQGSNTALPMVGYFMKEVNNDSQYRAISEARFPSLPNALQQKLDCDLYELDTELWAEIEHTLWQKDSLMYADTLAPKKDDSFLQKLYKRKLKMMLASHARDSVDLQHMEVIE